MDSLFDNAARRACRYLESLSERGVAPDRAAVSRLTALNLPLQCDSIDLMQVHRELDEIGSSATTASAGLRFFGFVIGGALPAALAASWLAGTWDQNGAPYNVPPANAAVADVALHWLLDILGLSLH